MRAIGSVLLVMTILLLAACSRGTGQPLKVGTRSFEDGDLRAAMVQWRYLEAQEQQMNEKGRCRYLVYRGLTHYRLYRQTSAPVEERAALHYLARGQSEYDSGKPRWLEPETVYEMKQALAELATRAAGPNAYGTVVVQAPPPPPQVVVPPPRKLELKRE